eukprot:CAMPEP_0194532634 /NCGR_PEP_ID=MMETSP0253-20130528/70262_1 /TAXON_ID=2966 /ORGANISM="Noctiluca scintillans" /LENGTH=73 /DNA_ID=CAMNT_0039378105 /DNA_START=879 /DNA_END=1100 /DNA_ORIENTATION=+
MTKAILQLPQRETENQAERLRLLLPGGGAGWLAYHPAPLWSFQERTPSTTSVTRIPRREQDSSSSLKNSLKGR